MHWKINVIYKDLFISYDYLYYSPKKCWLGVQGCTSLLNMSVRWYHRPMTYNQYWQVVIMKAATCKHPAQLSPIAPPALFRDAPYNLQVCMMQTFHDYLLKVGRTSVNVSPIIPLRFFTGLILNLAEACFLPCNVWGWWKLPSRFKSAVHLVIAVLDDICVKNAVLGNYSISVLQGTFPAPLVSSWLMF